jgi:[acyl-carrier-protein] S-malonyltransferase
MTRAVIFAGQGAQTVGMGRDLAAADAGIRALYERADAVLGYALSTLCFEGPEEELTRTSRCQPAIFVTSMACLAALEACVPGLEWAAAGGLSLGEWTALHRAGVLGFEDTVRVLEARGRFMEDACAARAGGMLSVIGLTPEALDPICREAGVEIANLNSPGQTVLSGPREGIAVAERLAVEAGAKRVVLLNVAGAYHSSLMAPAAEQLNAFLQDVDLAPAHMPVASNATGGPHGDADAIRDAMVRQVTGTVRWVEDVQWLKSTGVQACVECGPGKVLSGLIKRIDRTLVLHDISDAATLEKAAAALREA